MAGLVGGPRRSWTEVVAAIAELHLGHILLRHGSGLTLLLDEARKYLTIVAYWGQSGLVSGDCSAAVRTVRLCPSPDNLYCYELSYHSSFV